MVAPLWSTFSTFRFLSLFIPIKWKNNAKIWNILYLFVLLCHLCSHAGSWDEVLLTLCSEIFETKMFSGGYYLHCNVSTRHRTVLQTTNRVSKLNMHTEKKIHVLRKKNTYMYWKKTCTKKKTCVLKKTCTEKNIYREFTGTHRLYVVKNVKIE